ncbi:hypothetical protein OAF54_00035 [bacterium]|nr:hypothetical protein [bacterium]
MMLKLLTLLLLISCGSQPRENTHPSRGIDTDILIPLRTAHLESVKGFQDEYGFIGTAHCDALLFTGLLYYGLGHPPQGVVPDLSAAEDSPGEWHRRPSQDCWESGASRSTISRDMLLGVMWASQENTARLQQLWDYGEQEGWLMGDGRFGGADTWFPPAYQALLSDMLGRPEWRDYDSSGGECEAFSCHVQVLRILLREKARGGLTADERENLEYAANKYPDNPLFQWAAGNRQEAVDVLASQYQPGLDPFCEAWPLQQNADDNWARCPEGQDSGGGFLFLSQLMLDSAI